MKKSIIAFAAASLFAASNSFAGTPYVASTSPAPEPLAQGGFYFGLFGGVTFQGDEEDGSASINGVDITVDEDSEIGGHGGLELGYIFPSSSPVKFAIELEGLYTGFSREADIDIRGDFDGFSVDDSATLDGDVNSLVGLANFIIRGEAASWLTIYAGAGAGFYYSDIDDLELQLFGQNTQIDASGSEDGFAWQLLGGVEIPVSETLALFAEYNYLKFEDSDVTSGEQHLVSGGFRIFW